MEVQSQGIGRIEKESGADPGHEERRYQRNPEQFFLPRQIDRRSPEREDRQRLVAPAKPAPDRLEALGIANLPDEQGDNSSKERHADVQALADGALQKRLLRYMKEKNIIFGGRLAEYKYYDMAPIVEKVLKETELL